MKTTLFALALLTTSVCSAQPARTLETTINSWNFPNLSTETFDARGIIIAGTTERDLITGFQTPMFKLTDPALGFPPTNQSFYTRFNVNEDRYLMDFTVDQNTLSIIMVTMGPNNLVAGGSNMYISVINGTSGVPIAHVNVTPVTPVPTTFIPHQIIFNQAQNQYVIVGTRFTVAPTTANFTTASKTGFMLIVNAGLPMATVNMIETNTPSGPSGTDFDMLESVTATNNGYFAGGSANGIINPNDQNMFVMTASFAGVPGPTNIVDNTSNRSVVSSVMYNAGLNQVIAMSNVGNFRTYELLKFTPATVPVWPAVRHNIAGLTNSSVVNGFRLQQTTGGRILVAGYIWDSQSTTALLTPFQVTTNTAFTGIGNAKTFQSQNNSPLTGYFNESGVPVFINTPDMMCYRGTSDQTYLVNANTSQGGFDMLRSSPNGTLACEVNRTFSTVSAQWPFNQNAAALTSSSPQLPQISFTFMDRLWANTVLCASTPLAPIDNSEPTLEAAAKVKLFPNPAKDQLSIESDNVLVEAVVYDMKGNKVLAASNNETRGIQQLDISMLKPGMYILSMTDANGTLLREQFVKE